jgi:predicted ATP-binding protein involved in virulence
MVKELKKTSNKHEPSTKSAEKPSPVYFLSLELENVLCFKERQKLDLSDRNGNPAQWTVILGDNGVGKTTLLRCLAALETKLDVYEELEVTEPLLFKTHESRTISMWEEIDTLESEGANFTTCFACNKKLAEFKTNLKIPMTVDAEARILINSYYEFYGESLKGLVCYGYGAARRSSETSLIESLSSENSASLYSDNVDLINVEEWFLQTDYAIKSATGEIKKRLEKQFDQIRELLKRILPDIKDIRVAPIDENRSYPAAEFQTPYGWVRFSSLGLGYRTMVAWMVDLAMRLFQRYPDSPDPLAEPAIVLVDEIDLHLHPKWQRTIISFLTERFPNTQFIVTAHSPLIVQAARNANIVLLKREGDHVVIDNDPEIVDNWRVDQVLTSVFEMPTARPADVEKFILRRRELLAKSKLTKKDQAELKQLEEQIGSLPTGESQVDIRAMDIIRRAAQYLEQ